MTLTVLAIVKLLVVAWLAASIVEVGAECVKQLARNWLGRLHSDTRRQRANHD